MRYEKVPILVLALFALVASVAVSQAPAPAPGGATDKVTSVKQSLQQSMVALRQYQWVETMAIAVNGEQKAKKQFSCYYGADGKLQKTPIGGEPAGDEKQPRGIRGRIAEHKKEEITDSMQQAIGLVKQYVPPDPARIQAARDAGGLSLVPPDAQGIAKIVIKDYLKAGDSLTLLVDVAASRLVGVRVSTFTDSSKDAVQMKAAFGAFADGTIYPGTINLDVAAQSLAVAIENSGYKKLGN